MIATWSEALLRYPEFAKLQDVSTVSQAVYLSFAEGIVTSALAGKFSAPFSSNNITVKDLVVDMVYIQTQLTRQPEKAEALRKYYNERISSLLSGDSDMVDSSGMIAGTVVGDPVWSNTMDYHPTFGNGDPVTWEVSSAMTIAEDNARGHYPGESL